jgi:hypothetical protein
MNKDEDDEDDKKRIQRERAEENTERKTANL